MEDMRFAGAMLRRLRLEKNWSQETLCHGICAVSWLSKIEQGKAEPNEALLEALFHRIGVRWETTREDLLLREELYEGIFSWDCVHTDAAMERLPAKESRIGACHLDFLVIRAYLQKDESLIPREMLSLLEPRQRCLERILHNAHEEAYRLYPCPLTAFCVAEEAYHKGNYPYALEYLQAACNQAAREGMAYIQMICQHYMANCYGEMGNMASMERHSRIAHRLARALGDREVLETIAYNTAATQLEYGEYELAYDYFSRLEKHSVMTLHKLAIACEGLGKREEALGALAQAEQLEGDALEREMCAIVRYRLENPGYLKDPTYGEMLMKLFREIRRQRHFGFVRFHLPWVRQWLTANRKYREAYELMADFPENMR